MQLSEVRRTCAAITFVTCTENALQNNSFKGNNVERNSRSSTSNTALESWDQDRHLDVSTLESH